MRPVIQWRHQTAHGDPGSVKSYAGVQLKTQNTPDIKADVTACLSAMPLDEDRAPGTDQDASSSQDSPNEEEHRVEQLTDEDDESATEALSGSGVHDRSLTPDSEPCPFLLLSPSFVILEFLEEPPPPVTYKGCMPRPPSFPRRHYSTLTTIPFKDLTDSNDPFVLDTALLPGRRWQPSCLPKPVLKPRVPPPCPILAFLKTLRPPLGSEVSVFLQCGITTVEDLDRLSAFGDERIKTGKKLVESGLGDFFWKLVEDGLKKRGKTLNATPGCAFGMDRTNRYR